MKKSYYLFNPGKLSRQDHTLKFTPINEDGIAGTPRYLPIEDVDNLYCFGNLDANSALYNFLGKQQISLHFFDFYEHYTGSFMPKDYLLAGKVIISQANHYGRLSKRLLIAQRILDGAVFNMLKNLKYYNRREKDTSSMIAQIEVLQQNISTSTAIDQLMGIEGNIRIGYYAAFDVIINDFEMGNRTKQPPSNEVNALISFCNMLCYTACLDAIYHTQLNPTISYLHQPGVRRYSLALDLAEVFKPLLVDRMIFALLNKKQIQSNHFDIRLNSCVLKESGRKIVVKAWDERLSETILYKSLGRSVSYKHLIKLECYKLCKHILGIDEYKAYRAQ